MSDTFYGTFGFNQSLRNCYVKFHAEDMSAAHDTMLAEYGRVFAFVYPSDQFTTCIARYNLREVPFGTPNVKESDE